MTSTEEIRLARMTDAERASDLFTEGLQNLELMRERMRRMDAVIEEVRGLDTFGDLRDVELRRALKALDEWEANA